MPERVPIGEILKWRDVFERVALNPDKSATLRRHSDVILQLLNELLELREKEAVDG
jgi:hypothetical protein